MATNKFYIASGMIPDDNLGSSGTNKFYVTSGQVPFDEEIGTVCWGHSTSVEEDETRTFVNNWSGTGNISGSGDSEQIGLAPGQYVESELLNVGSKFVYLEQDKYGSGNSVTIKYKQGSTPALCEADSWHTYSAIFLCEGFVKIRLEG